MESRLLSGRLNAPANGRHDRGRDENGYDGGYDGGDDERRTGRVARTVTGLRLSTVEGIVPFPRTTGSGAKGWRVCHIRGHASVTESEPVAEVGGHVVFEFRLSVFPEPVPGGLLPSHLAGPSIPTSSLILRLSTALLLPASRRSLPRLLPVFPLFTRSRTAIDFTRHPPTDTLRRFARDTPSTSAVLLQPSYAHLHDARCPSRILG